MIPDLMREFAIGAALVGNLSALYFYSYIAVQIPGGILLERLGPRVVLAGGATLCGAGCILFGAAVAHTMTLALGMLGIVAVSPAIVEPLIAASIVYVGVENVLTNKPHRWRPVVVFGFGLLHGLGFAGVLKEFGLATDHFVTGLIAFNIGVELGQLAVIAICYLVAGLWFGHKAWYRRFVTMRASVAVALVGAWWCFERVWG
ncbi:MAG: hypothetical protein FJW24_05265 [Acidimicrobiia bacterium]|nr:hypothetical protein [Acidimicrobiia bacterium]